MIRPHLSIRPLFALVLMIALTFSAAAPPAFAAADGKVNVNVADTSELTRLPRVGPALAQRILDHRKANGPFKQSEDLMLVRGIGEKSFALMEPWVTTSGETTLDRKISTKEATATRDGGSENGSSEAKDSKQKASSR
ncbi:MAG: helix-hairpin-helix domain-containing protein [Acidobacteriota bacterium]